MVDVLEPGTMSGAVGSISIAITTKTSLSRGERFRSTDNSVKVFAPVSVIENPMGTMLDVAFKPVGMSVANQTRCINYTTPTNGLIFSTNLGHVGPSSICFCTTTPIGIRSYM